MIRLFSAAAIIAVLFSVDASVLTKSANAGVTCKTDYFGNYVCRDTYGNSSSTRRDYFGNDVTNFSNGGRMSCKTDYFGNYVCR